MVRMLISIKVTQSRTAGPVTRSPIEFRLTCSSGTVLMSYKLGLRRPVGSGRRVNRDQACQEFFVKIFVKHSINQCRSRKRPTRLLAGRWLSSVILSFITIPNPARSRFPFIVVYLSHSHGQDHRVAHEPRARDCREACVCVR